MLTEALAYRLLLLLSAFGSLLVAARVWRRRSAPASRSIAVFLAAMAEWALAVLLADLTIDTDTKLLLNTASYIGIAMIPVAWVAVALQYAGFHRWLTRPRLLLLSFVPLTSIVAAATNGAHRLFWRGVGAWERNGEVFLDLAIGPWFVVHTLYSYLLLAVGVGVLTRTILGSSAASLKQTTAYLVAVALPWTVNLLYHLGIGFFPGRDPTPAVFGLTALLMAWTRPVPAPGRRSSGAQHDHRGTHRRRDRRGRLAAHRRAESSGQQTARGRHRGCPRAACRPGPR
jgi:hypothetical protein